MMGSFMLLPAIAVIESFLRILVYITIIFMGLSWVRH